MKLSSNPLAFTKSGRGAPPGKPKTPLRVWLMAAAVLATFSYACTNTYLYDERRSEELPVDRAVSLQGSFCTLGANDVVRPIYLLVAMDASQSMNVTDPDGTRARALVDLISSLPKDPEIHLAVMLFAGSTSAFLTNNNSAGFESILDFSDADMLRLEQQILNYTVPGTSPNRDSTDFVKALADIYEAINSEIASARTSTDQALVAKSARSRFNVIFLSDGHPTVNQDDELIDGDAVTRIRELKDLVDDVRVNTVHVFLPAQPLSTVCDLSNDAGTGCPLLMVNQDAQRLETMAELGGGDFRDFRNNEPINFLNFTLGNVRRSWTVKQMVADNFSAPAESPQREADTDSDNLTDADERANNTSPFLKDTDGDGFSDGVEVYYAKRGATFHPAQQAFPDGGGLDPGCPPALRGVDTDCDGLLDCDEQLIGTNATLSDSDQDGIPDGVEWHMGTQGSSPDMNVDPDLDGLTNLQEVRLHLNPLVVDGENMSQEAYRYTIREASPIDADGRQCFTFEVDNVLLAPTLQEVSDAGTLVKGAGYNDIFFAVSMVPADDPNARTEVRQVRATFVRYPVGGIKSPPDGVLRFTPADFVDRCEVPNTDAGTP